MAVKKRELRALAVQVGMDVSPRANAGEVLRVKEPHDGRGLGNGAYPGRSVVGAGPVHMFVEAVVEEVVAIAAPGIGGTNPDRIAGRGIGVLAPGQVEIAGNPEHLRKLHIPADVGHGVCRVGSAVWRQVIFVIQNVEMRRQAPLLEVVQTGNALSFRLGFGQRWQQKRSQDGDNGDDDEQLDQRKATQRPLPCKESHF